MAGLNKIEDFLIGIGISYEEVGKDTWLIEDAGKGLPRMFITWDDPVVLIRANVTKIPSAGRESFFEELLRLNASMLHGAYALDGDSVVVVDTLEYADMDKSEFEASLDAIGIALSEHYPALSRYLEK